MRFEGIFARALEVVVVGIVFLPLVALHGLFCLNAMKLERLVIRMADRLDMRRVPARQGLSSGRRRRGIRVV